MFGRWVVITIVQKDGGNGSVDRTQDINGSTFNRLRKIESGI